MTSEIPLDVISRFGIAALLGLLIGLERGMKGTKQPHAGTRDFVLFAMAGALCAFAAERFDSAWVVVAGLGSVLAILISGYWADLRATSAAERGTTTELAGLVTFLLGISVVTMGAATRATRSVDSPRERRFDVS